MAEILAKQAGNWSDPDTWTGGIVPGIGDVAKNNGYAVLIDIDIECERLEQTGLVSWSALDGVNITADILATDAVGISVSNRSITITGDVTGGQSGTCYGINVTNGSVTITGDITGGQSGSCHGAYATGNNGSITITGDVAGGQAGSCSGAYSVNSSFITITGDVTGGQAGNCVGAHAAGNGSVTITGDITGGQAGNCHGAYANNGAIAITGGLRYGLNGTEPTLSVGSIPIQFVDNPDIYCDLLTTTGRRVLRPADYAAEFPLESDVRYPVSYDDGAKVGTCHVPLAANTLLGVPVDDTIGEALPISQAITDSAGITTLLSRITGLVRTKSEADTAHDEVISAIGNVPTATLSGPNTVTITVIDFDTSAPLEGALAKLYRTGSGQEVKTTDANGEASFTVVDATWQIGVTEGTHIGANDVIVVPSELSKVVSLVSNSITPPGDPSLSSGILRIIKQTGQPWVGVRVDVALVRDEFAASSYVFNAVDPITTDSDGIVPLTLLRAIAFADGDGVYEITVNQKYTFRIAAPEGATFTVTEAIG